MDQRRDLQNEIRELIEAEMAETIKRTEESGGKNEYYLGTERMREYFHAVKHGYGEWTTEYVKQTIEKLPRLSYVCGLRNFLNSNKRLM